jgi:O-antigen ligase
MKRRSQFVTFGIFLALCVGLIFAVDQMRIFVFKTEDIEGGLSLSGRDRIIGASWEGFLANPVFGNGFQVPSDFTEHGAATFGVSSEATTVEKCFFLTMLLEEVGILGTMLFLAVLGSLLAHWLRKGSYVAVSAMMAFLVINTGESCILSPSSIGGLCWLSIFATHNLRLLPEPWNS